MVVSVLFFLMVVSATTRCETMLLYQSDKETRNGQGISLMNETVPVPFRRLVVRNETTMESDTYGSTPPSSSSSSDVKLEFPLPRIEVQFVCEHDIRPDFNVTNIFDSFFQETLNHYFNQFMDVMHNDFDSWTENQGDTVSNLTLVGNDDDVELYSAITISDIGDVNRQYWFYPLCNASSTQILATMDVRGYVYLPSHMLLPLQSDTQSSGEKEDNNNQPPTKHHYQNHQHQHDKEMTDTDEQNIAAVMNFMEYFHQSVDTKILRNFFKERVCQPMDFFRSKVVDWDDKTFPPPSNRQPVKEYQSIHDPNAIYNHHHFFDHNLYLLCGGADDIMYMETEGEDGVDAGFFMIGIIVGMVMLSMLCTELKPYIGNVAAESQRRRNDGYATTNVTIQEVEMV
ncbi:hypothetical protein IV203_013066 [Nitzschia inconspicua]|uniref:Uncharacterized protein n=1 Tax=Nitzschia inconspicua TaxID=303405 RepID=A0A9K3M6B2_9STRA|nr:hypothetical protein IV203_013066 [Nitzschia inconspicua]